MTDIPERTVKAEEDRDCSNCRKKTRHRYEKVSFHTKALFVKVFSYKDKYIRVCDECEFAEELSKDEFKNEVKRVLHPQNIPTRQKPAKSYEKSKQSGIKYCSRCGERIYPDIGICTACAVKGK